MLNNTIENVCSARKNRLKAQVGEPSKGRSASACRSTDKGSAAAAAMARLELEDCESSNSGSLEDLVNSFDEKLTAVLQNYQEQVDKIAPVQVCARVLCGFALALFQSAVNFHYAIVRARTCMNAMPSCSRP